MNFFEQILFGWGFICGFVFCLAIIRIAIALDDEEKK